MTKTICLGLIIAELWSPQRIGIHSRSSLIRGQILNSLPGTFMQNASHVWSHDGSLISGNSSSAAAADRLPGRGGLLSGRKVNTAENFG